MDTIWTVKHNSQINFIYNVTYDDDDDDVDDDDNGVVDDDDNDDDMLCFIMIINHKSQMAFKR